MDWNDHGIVLSSRKHGESAAIVTLLTSSHGRHAGLVRGGAGRRARGIYQPGNRVDATWRARLAEHLGSYTCELSRAYGADYLDDPPRLLALAAACAILETGLPEREPHPVLFDGLEWLLAGLGSDGWAADYVRWELVVLAELGFGLDLSQCAATGVTDDLIYVSPRTGRAVSKAAGAPYGDRLLTLPAFLIGATGHEAAAPEAVDIYNGLKLTGHFLNDHVFTQDGHGLPAVRTRLVEGFR